jgi:two-component system response regulator DegU
LGTKIDVKTNPRNSILIGIVDDHPMYRMGLRRALDREADLNVIWELPSPDHIDEQLRRLPVDLILMDVSMGKGKNGIEATRDLSERWPWVKVVIISAGDDESQVSASSQAGAEGFLAKDLPISDMVSSIRRLAGDWSSGRRATGDLLEAMHRDTRPSSLRGKGRPTAGIESLSRRQRQVLDELRQGRTNREIAESMGISVGTVNKHVHDVLTALKARNRTEAVAIAGRDLT